MSRTLYLKVEQCIQVPNTRVTIGDVAKLECTDASVVNRLKTEKLFQISSDPKQKQVVSILFLLKKIHEIYPDLEVQNLGESDFILSVKPPKQSKAIECIKVILVCMVSFFGAVFAMMTFNEDVSTLDSFRKVYQWVMGTPAKGTTILEYAYSVGVGTGILVYFNQFGKRKMTKEPSPVEVEMSGYDKEVYTTLIKQEGRKGNEVDVG